MKNFIDGCIFGASVSEKVGYCYFFLKKQTFYLSENNWEERRKSKTWIKCGGGGDPTALTSDVILMFLNLFLSQQGFAIEV